ncbi:MAG: alpha/beta hydrolase [Candidatus Omnitrophica bacterium]|nr:alpha/beta hydrolase [Candidatus Omnitrophota bacterium]
MKKLIFFCILGILAVITLFAAAFLFIAFTRHENFYFEIERGGKTDETIKIDRFITDERVIYKSVSVFPHNLDISRKDEEISLARETFMPIRYLSRRYGVDGGKRDVALIQEYDKTNMLFFSYPVFLDIDDLETGEKTSLFSPEDLSACMALMERYNFWKKGTQFFEVMVPLDFPFPAIRTKAEVRHVNDTYFRHRGGRCEAEEYVIRGEGLPECKLVLTRYSHDLLLFEVPALALRAELKVSGRDFARFFSPIISYESEDATGEAEIFPTSEDLKARDNKGQMSGKKVFFESGNMLLEGVLSLPEIKDPAPAVIFLYDEGLVTPGEEKMAFSLSGELARNGIAMFSINMPGYGKSQGNYMEMDDEKRLGHIKAAFEHLSATRGIDENRIHIMGYRDSGYTAVQAAKLLSLDSCMMMSIPFSLILTSEDLRARALDRYLARNGLGPFENGYMEFATGIMGEHINSVLLTFEDSLYHMGSTMPLRAYREYLKRDIFTSVKNFSGTTLFLYGLDDEHCFTEVNQAIRRGYEEDPRVRISVLKKPGRYMGEEDPSEKTGFRFDKDALDVILKWINRS